MNNQRRFFGVVVIALSVGFLVCAQEPARESDDIVSTAPAQASVVDQEDVQEQVGVEVSSDGSDEFSSQEVKENGSLKDGGMATAESGESDVFQKGPEGAPDQGQEDVGPLVSDPTEQAAPSDKHDEAVVQEEAAPEAQVTAKVEVAEPVDREHTDLVIEDTEKISTELAREAAISPEDMTFDSGKKRKETVELVHRAAQELKTQPLDVACNRFSHTKKFVFGDLYIFLFDVKGTCLAHGEDAQLIWQNLYDLKDWVGTLIVQDIIKKAKSGGGWVTYGWRNATKSSYVQLVEKDGVSYAIGSGYFSHSKEEAVVNIVKGGVAMFDRIKQEKQPVDWAFSRMSYPSGPFIAGDLYLYSLDFQGNIKAQGDRPGLIGSNAWNYQDANGLYVNREMVKKLQETTQGVWVDYVSKRATKRAYAEKVKGPDGKQYFIACGYYPDANRDQTVELVRKGYQFMKTSGKTNAVTAFSERRSDDFRYGDLALVVYDMKGKIIADGSNVDNIGRNLYNAQDEDGVYYVRDILNRATKEGIWQNAKIRGAFQSTYAQRIDLGVAQYVITCSYYPVSKPEMMTLLVQSAASYLKANPREKAFAEFVKRGGAFQRGDLKLTVVDTMGLCYAYGDDADLIWRNIFKAKDDDGRLFIKMFINEAQQGSSVVKAKLNHDEKTNFVTSIEKEGKTYIVASGYYQ